MTLLQDYQALIHGFKAIDALNIRVSIAASVVAIALLMGACFNGGGAADSDCWTDDETQYFEALSDIMRRVISVNEGRILLYEKVLDNPELFGDNQWRGDMLANLVEYSYLADEIRSLNPPQSVHSIHHDQLVIAQEMDNFAVMFSSAMVTTHIETMGEALDSAKRINEILKETHDNIDRFCR